MDDIERRNSRRGEGRGFIIPRRAPGSNEKEIENVSPVKPSRMGSCCLGNGECHILKHNAERLRIINDLKAWGRY
ncbi:hypothetical protein TWF506_002841 [Arthrobotrys conoides]|uniref:Uncharacterized protein n=1 Tax=Arthrobotrys conoides TaxID=74498 RepID=A0AAN8RKB6_9PEZI